MGIDLYVMAEDMEKHDDIDFCSRNLASEVDVFADLGKGTLLDYVSGEDDEAFHDPKTVLDAVQKTLEMVTKMDESEFMSGKDACLQELKGMMAVIEKAVEAKVNISVTIC